MDKSVSGLLGMTMEKVKQMVDVDTVVGTPITVEGITLIPVSMVKYGLAGGGSDLPNKSSAQLFGGGSGAGVTVTPVAFVCIKEGRAWVLPISSQPTTVDSLLSKLPDTIDQVSGMIAQRKEKKAAEGAEKETAETAGE